MFGFACSLKKYFLWRRPSTHEITLIVNLYAAQLKKIRLASHDLVKYMVSRKSLSRCPVRTHRFDQERVHLVLTSW